MLSHFTAPENLPFAVALGLFFVIGILQTVSLFTGISLFGWIDDLLPDLDAVGGDLDLEVGGDIDVDADVNIDADADTGPDSVSEASFIAQVFAWMNFGKVPFIITFLLFLFLFSFFGYNIQLSLKEMGLGLAPPLLLSPIALVAAILPLKWGNGILGRVIPKDETNAVSSHTFVGRIAKITIGEATHDKPAEAKLRGPLGRTHYVMVLADRENVNFKQGDHVLLVDQKGPNFTCIAVKNDNLILDGE
ncbi:OB-fold-containig protein [Rubellicoccus peritrichatus]|uniref:DUF1449 family protein n=1 Tax=Rubellicoccus peritrichatus TaxID=3080537 RepID=A0AAQ3L6M9_9BACT|nr:OB-fold-containig protein [Puniceicoccus sp. CR14]WOO40046.1 DUF1449 family protein [Puniceicoccus sp. CR14]